MVLANGEYVICASGELHLARCVRDLKDTFARDIELDISEPLVTFKETIVAVSKQELRDRSAYITKLNEAVSDDEEHIHAITTVFGDRRDHTKIRGQVALG